VTQRVRREIGAEATGLARLDERGSCGGIGQVGRQSPTGKEPASAAVRFPDLAEHLEDWLGQRENSLLVSLADEADNHLFGVDRGDGQRSRLGDPQAIGVHERETAANDGLLQRGNQAAAILVAANGGQAQLAWLADFFFVNRGQS
jgi:hypothetical protein